jgi:hypothetical protein
VVVLSHTGSCWLHGVPFRNGTLIIVPSLALGNQAERRKRRGCPTGCPEVDWHWAVAAVNEKHTRFERLLAPFQRTLQLENDSATADAGKHNTLLIDPFIYPKSVRDEFNPILNPAQY